jgi:hypothetical protein
MLLVIISATLQPESTVTWFTTDAPGVVSTTRSSTTPEALPVTEMTCPDPRSDMNPTTPTPDPPLIFKELVLLYVDS